MHRPTVTLIVAAQLAFTPAPRLGAQVPIDTLRTIARAAAEAARLGRIYGNAVWPGYRPDTIPVVFALPHRGFLLVGWHGAPPAGFDAVQGLPEASWSDSSHESTASTSEVFAGRTVAQVSVSSVDPDDLIPTVFHEAFHVFERASRRPETWFGETENAYYVASYPVFDVANEAAFALEGRVLAAATLAPTQVPTPSPPGISVSAVLIRRTCCR